MCLFKATHAYWDLQPSVCYENEFYFHVIESNTRDMHIDQSEPGIWNDKNMSILSKYFLCVRKRFAVASAYNLILIEEKFYFKRSKRANGNLKFKGIAGKVL